jgi:hypothetical protein
MGRACVAVGVDFGTVNNYSVDKCYKMYVRYEHGEQRAAGYRAYHYHFKAVLPGQLFWGACSQWVSWPAWAGIHPTISPGGSHHGLFPCSFLSVFGWMNVGEGLCDGVPSQASTTLHRWK